uniref:Uncharacterized protein n=1 Tax=Tanacetum cinerariifolium TaxID=118510 RepID=A0A6L2M3E8_TANCI|nr:hypothetical protein [Tanacetum cinerariifolium]
MDDDLFTYEVQVASILCDSNKDDDSKHEADDNMGYDPYGKVELTDEESSDDEDEVAEIQTYLLRTLRDSKLMKNLRMIRSMNGTEMYHRKLTWSLHSWKLASYQDYEWYEALMDSEIKEQVLRNKGIMEGLISDDESSNDGWRRWQSYEITYHDHDEIEYENETHNERQELCEAHELPMSNIRRFVMIKYSFRQDKKYVTVKEDEYNDWNEQTMMHAEHTRKSFAEWTNDGCGTESEVQDDNNRSGNDTDADDADIRPIYDKEPMAEVQLTAECNIFAIGQHHTEQPEIINEDHSKSPSSFSEPIRFFCSTCNKCVFNANHDACITKLLKEVNSRAKIQSHKTRDRNKRVDQKSHTQIPGRKIFTGHRFSPNKTSDVYEKISPRSDLRWKPTGRIFKSVGLRWLPTGKLFNSCTSKVESEPPHGSNVDISKIHECK